MAGVVIDELVTLIGVQANQDSWSAIKKMTDGLGGLVAGSAKLATGLAAAAAAGLYAADRFNRTTGDIGKLSDATGISSESLQKWGYAAERVGGSSKSIQSDLASLTRTMSSPVIGEYSQELAMMGVNVYKANGELRTADEVMMDLADAMQNMPAQTQLQWAGKLGISQDTLLLLQKGRGEIGKYFDMAEKDHAIISDESIKNARQFSSDIDRMGSMLSTLGANISSSLAPAIHRLTEKFSEFFQKHGPAITEFFSNFVSGAFNALAAVTDFLSGGNEQFNKYTSAMKNIWGATWDIISEIIGDNKEDINSLFEAYISGVNNVAKFLREHKDQIVGFFKAIVDTVKEAVAYVMKLYDGIADLLSLGKDKMDQWGVTGAIDTAKGWAGSAVGGVKSAWNWVTGGPSEAHAATIPPEALGKQKIDQSLSESVSNKPTASGTPPKGSWKSNERVAQAMAYYQSQGLSKEQAAGIVGNLQVESGLDTTAKGDFRKGEGYTAHGIAQWRGARLEGLKKFASDRGTSWEDYETQLAYVLQELKTTESGAGKRLAQTDTASEAALVMSKYYERPNAALAHNEGRIGYANAAMKSSPTINITQNIQGADPNAVAAKSADKIDTSLQAMFSGGSAPDIQH